MSIARRIIGGMPPNITDLLDFFLAHIRQNGSTVGMKSAAAKHFGVDRRTISNALAELRRDKRLGRDVYRKWSDS